jgi:hypothetical protein
LCLVPLWYSRCEHQLQSWSPCYTPRWAFACFSGLLNFIPFF